MIVLLTLKSAIIDRRLIVHSQKNHGAQIWSIINVRGKVCLSFVVLVSLIMGLDRLGLLARGYEPPLPVRWIAFGVLRTSMSVGVAFTAWANMRAFRRLRDG